VKTAVFHETRHAPDRAPYTLDTRRSGGSQASSGDARMKLAQAISLARDCDSQPGEPFRVFLACGFTPQHINVFLQAHLFSRLKNRRVVVDNGRYGDLAGSLAGLREDTRYDALIVLLEWSDLDARLGYRTTHGWRPDCVRDYPDTAAARLVQLRNLIEHLCARAALYLVLPTLPLPPAFLAATLRGDCLAFTLNERLMAFAATASAMPGVHVVNPHKVDALSPFDRRLDLASDVRAGFPYSLEHASLVCRLVSELIHPAARKKGIITDLDDTLWRGVLGEDGVDGVSWELSRLTHAHALYQEMLAALAEIGVLVAVATKNDPELVERALGRQDLVIPRDAIFPVEAGWGPKSAAVRRILGTWNIAADSVVFVDDSPLELAEVSAALPDIQCIRYPTRDDRAVCGLLQELRDLCGKSVVTEEDRLRLASIRASSHRPDALAGTTPEEFLKSLGAEISLVYDRPDERAFELVNKTNQFNLNGRRLDEAAWRALLAQPDRFLLSVSYRDKFGPLGKIAVVSGRRKDGELLLDIWVMSCRAFSRRIEFQTLASLFDRFGVDAVCLEAATTERNRPFREFAGAMTGADVAGPIRITKADFRAACPELRAKVVIE
jgi:FkbH-like protein